MSIRNDKEVHVVVNMRRCFHNRVFNWKFRQAGKYASAVTPSIAAAVKQLADKYGDLGWVDEADLALLEDEGLSPNDVLNIKIAVNRILRILERETKTADYEEA